jgi:Plavaka transposase
LYGKECVLEPFWANLPFANIHLAIMPDVLYQIYQGVLKHLINWRQILLSKEELDLRIHSLPLSFGVRHFNNGISALSQVSGTERKHIGRILLGCLVGAMPSQGIKACKALLDFIFLAQYPTHDNITLGYMKNALGEWDMHKSCFINTGIREDLNIPKFYSLQHYVSAIELLGTTDNYNTEMFGRLHIDFAKRGWRASNHRDEFPQMVRWLSRQEKMSAFDKCIEWLNIPHQASPSSPATKQKPLISIAKHPPRPGALISKIESSHSAPGFSSCLLQYLNGLTKEPITNSRLLSYFHLPFTRLDVFNQFRFHPTNLEDDIEEKDTVKAMPKINKSPARFDPAVVIYKDNAESTGLEGVFSLFL